jgi:cytochrome c peroxidase
LEIDVPYQTLPPDPLELTDEEKKALVKFMQSLTDTTGITSRPKHLPLFPGNLSLNERKIGGMY